MSNDTKGEREPLVKDARTQGRWLYIVSYCDGATEIKASMLFRTADDAQEAARVLKEARRP